jgi:hypothetical protein
MPRTMCTFGRAASLMHLPSSCPAQLHRVQLECSVLRHMHTLNRQGQNYLPSLLAHPTCAAAASPLTITHRRVYNGNSAILNVPPTYASLLLLPLSSAAPAQPSQDENTPFYFAAVYGFLDVIDKLLDMGAAIDAQDQEMPICRKHTHLPSRPCRPPSPGSQAGPAPIISVPPATPRSTNAGKYCVALCDLQSTFSCG